MIEGDKERLAVMQSLLGRDYVDAVWKMRERISDPVALSHPAGWPIKRTLVLGRNQMTIYLKRAGEL